MPCATLCQSPLPAFAHTLPLCPPPLPGQLLLLPETSLAPSLPYGHRGSSRQPLPPTLSKGFWPSPGHPVSTKPWAGSGDFRTDRICCHRWRRGLCRGRSGLGSSCSAERPGGVASLQSQPHWHQAGWSSVILVIHICPAPARLPLLLRKPGSTLQSREASLLPLCFLPHPLSSGYTGLQGSVDPDSLPPPPPPAEVPADPSAWATPPPGIPRLAPFYLQD